MEESDSSDSCPIDDRMLAWGQSRKQSTAVFQELMNHSPEPLALYAIRGMR